MSTRSASTKPGIQPNSTPGQIARHINDVVMQGHLNNTLDVTLPIAPAATFTVSDVRIGPNTWMLPMATDAAGQQAVAGLIVPTRNAGSAVLEFTTTTATAVITLAFLNG